MRSFKLLIITCILMLSLIACATAPETEITYDPATLKFDGEQAFAKETDFVTQFPNRDSGQPNNRLAVEWLRDEFTRLGLICNVQDWEVINYSRRVPLNNLVCELPGKSAQQIVILAHHDQFPGTIEGADNDGSGIAIMLHLAEIFSAEPTPDYSLVFLSTDGEEYGMLGSGHYIETHPDPTQIIAAFSLDNLGKEFYDGVRMSATGQLGEVGPLWLQQLAQNSAEAAGDIWVPMIKPTFEQALTQAVPISLWDQGPLVAAGVPAIGFGENCPAEHAQECWETYHSPSDTLEIQSPETLHQSGRIAEASVRQLLAMKEFPKETGPYLFFEESGSVLRGPALWLIFIGFVALFLFGAWFVSKGTMTEMLNGWLVSLPHFIGLWLPWVASTILLYIFVEVGIMQKFQKYPGVAKDRVLFEPRWPAVILFVLGLAILFWLGHKLASHFTKALPDFRQRKSLAFLVIGLAGVYILVKNPFSLIFLVPVLFWFLIGGRSGAGKILDWVLYLLGGLVVYVLLYFFGVLLLRNNLAILWYILMMFSIRMVGFWSMAMITAVIAAGMSMVINPPEPVPAASVVDLEHTLKEA